MPKRNRNTGAEASGHPDTANEIPTFPPVQAGRHPWFYFEDGNIVLKVDYPRLPLDGSNLYFATLAATNYPLQGSPTLSHRELTSVQRYVDLGVVNTQYWGRFQRRQPYITSRR